MQIFTDIYMGAWETLTMMAPYLLLGFLLSGILSVLLPVRWVKRHLARPGKASVVKAAILGVPLPLCSCGVLPVAAWMRRHGGSKGAVGAFLLSTPQTGVDGFLVALGLLGLGMAVYIPFAAFVSGVILGLVLNFFKDPPREIEPDDDHHGNVLPAPLRMLRHGFVTIAGDIAIPLTGGILIAGVISGLVDENQLAMFGNGFLTKLLIVAVATPMYVCDIASLPVAAAMLAGGLSPGTVFVFLMAGPATNAATFTTISKLIGKKEAVVYLICALFLAMSMGYLLDSLAPVLPPIEAAHCHGEAVPRWRALSAIALIAVLVNGKIQRKRKT
ncbi:MAG: permease [Verrucomicrobia bacterium]|nr:permease [Verrucomicrobiota bacterium]MCH8513385.1 permease [Kiritimatiellia bacterium]